MTPFVVAALLGFLADPGTSTSPPPRRADPHFRVIRADGPPLEGALSTISPDGTVSLKAEGGMETAVPIRSIFKLERVDTISPRGTTREGLVLLAGGDSISGRIVTSDEEVARVRSLLLGNLSVPMDMLLGAVAEGFRKPGKTTQLGEDILTQTRESDVLWLANGDRVTGTLVRIDEKVVSLEVDTGPQEIERVQVHAIGMDPSLISPPEFEGPYLEVHLVDGSRISGQPIGLEGGKLRLQTGFGAELSLATDVLTRAYVRQGSFEFLTDREVTAAEYVEYIGPVRPYRIDRNAAGEPLRVGEKIIDHGIGTQSRTLLAFALQPGDQRFQARAALDDRAGPWGSVVFKVMVDGKTAFESAVVRSGDAPVEIDVPVAGGRFLILATEFGPGGSVQDDADWLEPRLLK